MATRISLPPPPTSKARKGKPKLPKAEKAAKAPKAAKPPKGKKAKAAKVKAPVLKAKPKAKKLGKPGENSTFKGKLKRITNKNEVRKVTKDTIDTFGMEPGEVTPAQRRLLQIVKDNPNVAPAQFAKLAWPNAEGWKSTSKIGMGRGNHTVKELPGGGMILAAGAALGKLRLAGWLDVQMDKRTRRYTINAEGLKALK